MRIFELVKENVTVPQAAQRYGMEFQHGKARCPFHNDHTPSLLVKEDHYYCFGCGAHGDVIDLVAGLFSLSSCEAAKKLVSDFGLDPRTPPAGSVLAKVQQTSTQQHRACENRCFNDLHDYLWQLRDWQEQFAPKSPDDTPDERFVEACQHLPHVEYLLDEWLAGGGPGRNEIMNSAEVSHIRTRLAEIRKEVRRHERNERNNRNDRETLLAG